MSNQDLSDRIALITGAGQGVGQGIAFALAARGAKVGVSGRTLSKCEATRDEIVSRGGQAIAIECDVKNTAHLENAVNTVVETYGGLNVLVNNAIQSHLSTLLQSDDAAFMTALEAGPVAALRLMKLCYPHLKGDGSIINLASTAAKRWDMNFYSLYAAEKEALRALTRGAASEWGPDNIRANVILPHATSPGLKGWIEQNPDEAAAFIATIPMKRIGDCEEDIGRFAASLCSADSKYVSGQSIAIDGGQAYMG